MSESWANAKVLDGSPSPKTVGNQVDDVTRVLVKNGPASFDIVPLIYDIAQDSCRRSFFFISISHSVLCKLLPKTSQP